jgi:hypothetical protein
MTFDYNTFIKNVYEGFVSHQGDQRYGQYMMNYLYQVAPEIEVPLDIDPFYDNSKVPDLMNYLHSLHQNFNV